LLQALLAACLIGAIAPGAGLAQEGTSLERAIKATYLWKFAPFTFSALAAKLHKVLQASSEQKR
jgi:hypothetical protein